jgi:hypothetical protein
LNTVCIGRGPAPDDRAGRVLLGERGPQLPGLVFRALVRQRAIRGVERLGQFEGLREIIERAPFDRLHRGVQVAVRGDDHDRRVRHRLAKLPERGEAVHAGQSHVEEHHVRRVAARLREPVLGGRGHLDAVLLALERPAQRPRDRLLVVDNQYGVRHVGLGVGQRSTSILLRTPGDAGRVRHYYNDHARGTRPCSAGSPPS